METFFGFNPPNTRGYKTDTFRTVQDYKFSLPGIHSSQIAQMQQAHPRKILTMTKKKKKGYKRHFPYKRVDRSLVPKTRIGWLKYVSDDLSYAPGATSGILTFSMNDLNDPGAALSATKCQWWTELAAMYKMYKVHVCSWHVHISNTTADQVQGGHCTVEEAEIPPTTAAGLTEAIQKGKPFWLGATDENLTNHADLTGLWQLKRYVRAESRDAATYGSEVTSQPNRVYQTSIVLNSASNISVKYRIIMHFYVELYELQQNAPD